MSEEFIEYRVRQVTRYIVTRYEQTANTAGCTQHGEFDRHETAHAVGYALAKAEHDRLGYPPGDMRIRYPDCQGLAPAIDPAVDLEGAIVQQVVAHAQASVDAANGKL